MSTQPTVFDIETAGLEPADQLLRFEPKFSPAGNLKDPEKIQNDISGKQEDWLAKAALDACRARVLCIGIQTRNMFEMYDGNEEAIIKRFWALWEAGHGSFIGHNAKSFDVPFLIRRSYILGIKVPFGIMEGRYMSRRIVDTMEAWGCGVYGEKVSLDTLARALGVGKKSGNGKDFAQLYKEDKASAIVYLQNDVQMTWKVAEEMGLIPKEVA